MLSFHKTTDDVETVPGYVSDLERRLRTALPASTAEQIAQETREHLSDRVDDLTRAGVTQQEAEAIAVLGFGPVRMYARSATLNAYGDRTSARWQLIGRLAVVNLLAFQVVYPLAAPSRFFLDTPADMLFALAGACCFLLIPVAAFCYRLSQTRTLLAFLGVALLSITLGAGLRYVPNADSPLVQWGGWDDSFQTVHGGPGILRGDHAQEIVTHRADGALLHQEATRLRQGMAVYRQHGTVPPELRLNGRYVVPRTYALTSNRYYENIVEMDTSAFQDSAIYATYLSRHNDTLRRVPTATVNQQDSAERLWATEGPRWLAWKNRRVAYREAEIATLENANTAPLSFNSGAATFFATLLLRLSLPLLVLEFVCAHLGRAAWIHARNVRRRRTA